MYEDRLRYNGALVSKKLASLERSKILTIQYSAVRYLEYRGHEACSHAFVKTCESALCIGLETQVPIIRTILCTIPLDPASKTIGLPERGTTASEYV